MLDLGIACEGKRPNASMLLAQPAFLIRMASVPPARTLSYPDDISLDSCGSFFIASGNEKLASYALNSY